MGLCDSVLHLLVGAAHSLPDSLLPLCRVLQDLLREADREIDDIRQMPPGQERRYIPNRCPFARSSACAMSKCCCCGMGQFKADLNVGASLGGTLPHYACLTCHYREWKALPACRLRALNLLRRFPGTCRMLDGNFAKMGDGFCSAPADSESGRCGGATIQTSSPPACESQ